MTNTCNSCFGAAAGDCTTCRWNNEDIQEERETHSVCELCMDGEMWEKEDDKRPTTANKSKGM